MEKIWEEIKSKAAKVDLDMYTIKQNGNKGLWFNLKSDLDRVVVTPSKFNNPSIRITTPINIKYEEFERIAKHYESWKTGNIKRSELSKLSMNSSYIFGMMNYFYFK